MVLLRRGFRRRMPMRRRFGRYPRTSFRRRYAAPLRTGGFQSIAHRFKTNSAKYFDALHVDATGLAIGCQSTAIQRLLTYSSAINTPAGLALGTSSNNRIGTKILNKRVIIRGQITQFGSVDPVPTTIRVLVFYDAQSNKAVPSFADLFESGPSATAKNGIWAFNNMQNTDRFKIMCDKFYVLQPTGGHSAATATSLCERFFNIKCNLKGLTTVFTTAYDGNYTGITSGGLWLVIYSDLDSDSVGAYQRPFAYSVQSRIRFWDYA